MDSSMEICVRKFVESPFGINTHDEGKEVGLGADGWTIVQVSGIIVQGTVELDVPSQLETS